MSRSSDHPGPVVLVTGASGFLGGRTVAALAEGGWTVRALVRQTSRTGHLSLPGVSLWPGDVTDAESMVPAFTGAEYVVHAAADTGGSEEAERSATVCGTRNVLALSDRFKVSRLVYISSCSVYGTALYRRGEVVTEQSPLERFPEKRGNYSHAKFLAEQLVTEAMAHGSPEIVCLRPGTLYGPGSDLYPPMLGLSFGRRIFAVIGNGDFILPLVYVDNMVGAILAALTGPVSGGQIYNVIDPDRVTKRQYMKGLVQRRYPGCRTVYLPFVLVQALVLLQEGVCRACGRQPLLTRYRLNSSQRPVVYDASKISRELHWQPTVSVPAAFATLGRGGANST